MALELIAGEKQPGETKKSIQACNDYLRMGPGRSLAKLLRMYGNSSVENPPVKVLRTAESWSANFGWVARAELYDAEIEREKNELLAERRRIALETGVALDYERVMKLKELSSFLFDQIAETNEQGKRPNVWVKDVKGIGKGENFERVEIERFNSALISEFRSTLDDIAKEVGGRKQKLELGSDEEKPFIIKVIRGVSADDL